MAALEGPDESITLQRAAAISGLAPNTLRVAAQDGRLAATRIGRDWLTTRRNLHRYLRGRSRGAIKPVPADYPTPDGEAQL
jgi:hypothetical protein